MNFLIKPISFAFFLLSSLFSFSQVVSNSGLNFTETASLYQNTDIKSIKGSPYVNEIFTSAIISPLEKLFPVRYNAVSDEIEVSVNDDKILALDKNVENYVITFQKDNKKYVLLTQNGELGYFVELKKNDKISLYKKERKIYHPKEAANSSYQQDKPAYFSDLKITYYLTLASDNSNLLEFTGSKNTLFKLFPKHKNELKSFLKNENINLKDEKDIVKTASYIDQLL